MFERIFGPSRRSTLIDAAFDDISSMLERARGMMRLSVRSLLDNEPLEADIDEMDDRIDESERMVRRSVLEHLSVNPQQDLVASLVLVSMVQDAERVGDFANGIAELVRLAAEPRRGPFAERLRSIVERLDPQFVDCERAFRKDDPDVAETVIARHRELRSELKEYVRDVADSDLSANMAVVYSGAARILRRMSAHLANIATSVVLPYDQIRHGDEDV
ncbi:MAG: PhoU domain-containing protein [Thermoanaerobaculia bacterium]|nr:PhoU domain-containing protein [Thermoanaerobaculia bacterium]